MHSRLSSRRFFSSSSGSQDKGYWGFPGIKWTPDVEAKKQEEIPFNTEFEEIDERPLTEPTSIYIDILTCIRF